MLVVLLILGIFLTLQKKRFVPVIVIPITLTPILILSFKTLKGIKEELSFRERVKERV